MHIRGITGLLICIGIGRSSAEKADAAVRVKTVVLSDEQGPGMPQGVVLAELGRPDINAAQRIAFHARFGGTGVTTSNDSRGGPIATVH